MIKVNELRVGNYILLDTGFVLPLPHVIMPKDIYDLAEGKITLNAIEGIPLDESWLRRAGFSKYQWQDGYFINTYHGDLYIHFYKGKIITRMVKVSKDGAGQKMYGLSFIGYTKSIDSLIYVHQLQNLYYCLSGEELTIAS